MDDGYYLNVALQGQHYCHIKLGQIIPEGALRKARDITKRFPTAEGFKCTMTKWECRGYSQDIESTAGDASK